MFSVTDERSRAARDGEAANDAMTRVSIEAYEWKHTKPVHHSLNQIWLHAKSKTHCESNPAEKSFPSLGALLNMAKQNLHLQFIAK